MPSTALTPSSLYPLAILDCGGSSLRITLQLCPPSTSLPPVHIAPNAIARTRPPVKEIFLGSDIERQCTDFSGLTLRLPIERGFTTDWVAAKALWDAEIGKALAKLPASKQIATSSRGKLLEGWNLIITEAYFNLPELEHAQETMWFEEYGVRALWRTTAAQLASFAPLQPSPLKPVMSSAAESTSTAYNESVSIQDPSSADAEQDSPIKPSLLSSSSQGAPATTASRRQKRHSSTAQVYSEPKSKSKTTTTGVRLGSRRRPEACVMIDLGHSYTHVVPMVQGEVVWSGVRRLDIGGKLMTNMLKEMISFQQWDMMEESWIISHLKEKAFFVAASDVETERIGPGSWNKEKLLRLTKSRKGHNPIEQEYVLPDYSDTRVSKNAASRYGRIRKGPGKSEATSSKKVKVDAAMLSTTTVDQDGDGVEEGRKVDAFIAGAEVVRMMEASSDESDVAKERGGEDEDEDEDEGEDYRDTGSESSRNSPIKGSFRAHQQQQQNIHLVKRKVGGAAEGEEEQVLVLSNERWQIPELLFNPQQIHLDALPLPELILSSITAASRDDALRGLMLANIVLVGGLAAMPNLRRRLEVDLRCLSPDDVAVRVRVPDMPAMAGVNGGLHLPKGFLTGKLMSREEWEKPGMGTTLSREKFLGWSSEAGQQLCKMLL